MLGIVVVAAKDDRPRFFCALGGFVRAVVRHHKNVVQFARVILLEQFAHGVADHFFLVAGGDDDTEFVLRLCRGILFGFQPKKQNVDDLYGKGDRTKHQKDVIDDVDHPVENFHVCSRCLSEKERRNNLLYCIMLHNIKQGFCRGSAHFIQCVFPCGCADQNFPSCGQRADTLRCVSRMKGGQGPRERGGELRFFRSPVPRSGRGSLFFRSPVPRGGRDSRFFRSPAPHGGRGRRVRS